MDVAGKYKDWSSRVLDDPELAAELAAIRENEKEIYEGDIVKAILIDDDLLCMGEVVYDEIMSFLGLFNDAGVTPLFRLSQFEVIGNIHDKEEK